MPQLLTRLFEKWVADASDLTFDEWRKERQAQAMRARIVGAVIPISDMQAYIRQQYAGMPNSRLPLIGLGQALGGALGSLFPR